MSARSIRRSHQRRKRRRRVAGATGAVIGAAAIAAPAAGAATYPVTNANDGGPGSLRQAVIDANANPGADTITFSGAGASGTIRLTTGEIAITDDVTITGPGAGALSITGDKTNNGHTFPTVALPMITDSRIFRVTDPTNPGSPVQQVTITGLTLRDGVAAAVSGVNYLHQSGGAIISSSTKLTLADMTFTDNVATSNGGAVALGSGSLHIADSTFASNAARDDGGAVYSTVQKYEDGRPGTVISDSRFTTNRAGGTNFGGFGYSQSPAAGAISAKYGRSQLEGLTVTGNVARTTLGGDDDGEAGGVNLGNGVISDSTIAGNSAPEQAGGVLLEGAKLLRSTVTGNSVSSGSGGGVLARSSPYGGTSRIDLSTISGNAAGGSDTYQGLGGGVLALSQSGTDTALVVRNSTIASNTAAVDGGGLTAWAYLTPASDPITVLKSALLADNSAAGSPGDLSTGVSSGTLPPGLVAAGFSLIENPGSTVLSGDPAGSNITGVDPKLAPLGDNGGPTKTQTIAPTSAAVDSAQANGFATDQTGGPRTVDAAATNAPLSDGTDIGAVELNDPAAVGGDPDTEFTKKPPKKLKAKGKKGKKVKLKFSGTINSGAPAPLGFECKVDKGRFEQCASPLKLKLATGKHTIEVRAVDSTGRTDSTPAKAKIKVKKKKPKK